jgi:hypothetical protein
MTKKKSKMLLLSMLATANLADDAEARDWVGKMPYSVRGAFGIKREVMIHPNNVMYSLQPNSGPPPSFGSHTKTESPPKGRPLTKSNINRLTKQGRNTQMRKSHKKTGKQSKRKK